MTNNNIQQDKPLLVAGIGGSAGAFEAVRELVSHLTSQNGIAYVYLQHQPADFDSQMVPLLAKKTKVPVLVAEEGMEVQPDVFYIVPPGKELTLKEGLFRLAKRASEGYDHMPINRLFSSVADAYKELAIGVVLSGADGDGAQGLKAIKAAGGLSFAQDASAQFQSMPQTAIAIDAVDLVLSPKEIAEELNSLGRQKDFYFSALQDPSGELLSNKDKDLIIILQMVQKATSVDFGQYKMSTIKRRIIRRILLHKLNTLQDYVQYMRAHPAETQQLFNDLLINVTHFFRDKETTEYLKNKLFPEIIAAKQHNEPIRIWVPACSSGQEVYSIAIILIEVLGEHHGTHPIQIFASDLSETAIHKARLGMYSTDEITGISPKRLQRFFTKVDGQFRINKSIRDLCVFATQNITLDPPFSRLDLVSCCNFLIYIDNNLQQKIMSTFHYALNNNGYLVLGKSETVGSSAYLFSQVDKKVKVFAKKKDTPAKALFPMSYLLPVGHRVQAITKQKTVAASRNDDQDLEKAVDTLLLKKFTPASVVINHDMDIVQFRGSTGIFLEPTPGKASLNLLKMARPGLAFELRNTVHKAIKSGEAVKKSDLELTYNDKVMRINVEVVPIKSELEESYFLVAFSESGLPPEVELSALKDHRVKQLETELSALREDMRSIVEEQEASVEELQSANEEIVSANEELQSINEELETSKEEVESSNEELITINQELQLRNEQLTESQDYAQAVFSTIREALLILDRNLRVKLANFQFYRMFQLREEHTEGRMLYELNSRQWDIPELRQLLEEKLPGNAYIHGLEITHNFAGIGEKTLVINARRIVQRIHSDQLTLLALEDITEHRRAQQIIADRELWFRNLADNAPVMIWVTDKDKKATFFNKAWLEFRSDTMEEALVKGWMDDVHPEDRPRLKKLFDDCFQEKLPFELKYRVLYHDTEYKLLHNKAKPNFSPEGQFLGYIGSCVVIQEINAA
ncbi:two-component system, chemotaxis family, CheB/CheR fusion protein [Cnuella takakiae]|uniref:protein-glutamate O-methyltransferase n=1 Tax=Cnuella takakiae TaxID=1302690 RepID=A0A1M4WFT2_9BACT|nr:CheR family methyltransferase [Cnuella takakiae]OLY91726.1 hypothetical protein BUE76_07305 [Cnuella takakiae]SHE80161.1 two-component system, chemotaxis family, CheB/CheR fusion protein [Cnuella takakiae]